MPRHSHIATPDTEHYGLHQTASEILGYRSRFFERWALLLFLLILFATLFGGWMIKYPYVVQASAIITAANGPRALVPHIDGKITQLFAENGQQFQQGASIAWIESIGSHEEVQHLKIIIDSSLILLQADKMAGVSKKFAQSFQNLGELQIPYQQFTTAWQQFNDHLVNGYYYKRKQVLEADLQYLKAVHDTTEQQKALLEQDVRLTQGTLDANNSLFKEKVISEQDLRDQKGKLVAKQLTLPQICATLLINENQQIDKQRDINELEHSISQQKIIFQGALQTLKSLTDEWVNKYTIKAPVDGKLIFFVPLQEGQYVQAGKTLGYLNPSNTRYYALVTLPQYNMGKIAIGQRVRLSFDAYPYAEYGYVPGQLSYISQIAADSGFMANITLPHGLQTNYGKDIQYGNGLKAHATIVTRQTRLIQRLYNSVIDNLRAN